MVMFKEDCENSDIYSNAHISTMCNSFEGKSLFCFYFYFFDIKERHKIRTLAKGHYTQKQLPGSVLSKRS